jgi:hypothetical protein
MIVAFGLVHASQCDQTMTRADWVRRWGKACGNAADLPDRPVGAMANGDRHGKRQHGQRDMTVPAMPGSGSL